MIKDQGHLAQKTRLWLSSEGTQYWRLLVGFPDITSNGLILLTAPGSVRGIFAVSQHRHGSWYSGECGLLLVLRYYFKVRFYDQNNSTCHTCTGLVGRCWCSKCCRGYRGQLGQYLTAWHHRHPVSWT